jgi:3-oxoacyl-[acyl-carrier protein] reductase
MSLAGRTCLVTGSSRGIGEGIATELGECGANVVVNCRSAVDAAAGTVEAVKDAGGEAIAVQADVTDEEAVRAMRDRVHDAFGPLDVLVNNAGITQDTRFVNMEKSEWDRVLDVHLGGMFLCSKVFYDDLAAAEDGRLINISSIVGKQGNFGQANYATAKSGMFGFTRTLALELADEGSTANAVAPGFTRTQMLEAVPERVQDDIREDIPLGRFGTVEDVSAVVCFLAGTESAYVTGEVIDVNGGMDL